MAVSPTRETGKIRLLQLILDAIRGAFGYTDESGTYQSGAAANTQGGTPQVSQGTYQNVPTPSTGSLEIPGRPAYTSGLILTIPAGASVEGYKDVTGLGSHPAPGGNTKVYANSTDNAVEFPIYLSGPDSFYVVDSSDATALAEWVQS